MARRQPGVREAIGAAVLFGAAAPFASRLVGEASPQVLAGLLYLGSGLVLGASILVLPRSRQAPLTRHELPALAGAVLFGGGLGPLLLMVGLRETPASTASLLLNLEVVFTAVIAWAIFREGFDKRVAAGFGLIVAGSAVLSWTSGDRGVSWGSIAVGGACACWAIDNNVTQLISSKDPRQIACLKGLLAGGGNLTIGMVTGGSLPSAGTTVATMAIGVVGYGLSLMLFVLALRSLGTARTGTYFAVAPFIGVAVAAIGFGESLAGDVWIAGALMASGLWLQVTERHGHGHVHEPVLHSHLHVHDDLHHDHVHAPGIDATVPHAHEHRHRPMVHSHAHRPDIHHRHH